MSGQALGSFCSLEPTFERLASERADKLLEDRIRIQDTSRTRGLRYRVIPALPVDKIDVYIFMPMASL